MNEWEGSKRKGRPPLDESASIVVTFRVTPTQFLDLRQIAEENQSRLASFIRQAIDEAVLDYRDRSVFRR